MARQIVVRLSVLMAAILLSAGCAGRGAKMPVAKGAVEEPKGPVIVHLVGQHQTITVTSGPAGPLYSARTRDGETIVANATLDELREQHPDVYQFIEPTVAVHADVGSALPDASRGKSTVGPVMFDARN